MKIELISSKCCSYCDSMNGKRFDLDFAFNNTIIDVSKCENTHTGFKGCVALTPIRDAEGNLVPIEEIIPNKQLHSNYNSINRHWGVSILFILIVVVVVSLILNAV